MNKNNFDNLNDKIQSVVIKGVEYKNNNFGTNEKCLDFGENTEKVINKMEEYMRYFRLLYFDMYYIDNNNIGHELNELYKYYFRYE